MKKSARCPKCEGTRIGRLESLPDATDIPRPAERSIGVVVKKGMLSDDFSARGRIEAHVCTECGYVEDYVADAKRVKWEAHAGFHWHVRPQPPPFR